MILLTDKSIDRMVAIGEYSVIAVYPHESQEGCVVYIEEIGPLHVTQEFVDVVQLVERERNRDDD